MVLSSTLRLNVIDLSLASRSLSLYELVSVSLYSHGRPDPRRLVISLELGRKSLPVFFPVMLRSEWLVEQISFCSLFYLRRRPLFFRGAHALLVSVFFALRPSPFLRRTETSNPLLLTLEYRTTRDESRFVSDKSRAAGFSPPCFGSSPFLTGRWSARSQSSRARVSLRPPLDFLKSGSFSSQS